MTANILVTGAAGYIGRLAVEALAADKRVGRLVGYDLQPADAKESVTVVRGDITTDDLEALLTDHQIDTVIHLASILKPPIGAAANLAWKVDVLGTRRLLEACIAGGVKHLVVTTSGAAYGYHPDNPMWLTEQAPTRGHDAFEYSRNKREVEALLARYRDEHPELTQLLLRPGTVIGQATYSPVTRIFEGRLIVGVAGSDAPFVFIWDRDLVEVLVQGALERRQGIYNLAGDGALTAREIARRLGKPYLPLPAGLLAVGLALLKRLKLSAHGPETVDFLRYRPVLDNRKLKEQFGYQPIPSATAFQIWLERSDNPVTRGITIAPDPRVPACYEQRPVVIITGGAGGIGRTLAHRWAVEGARIALLDMEAGPLEEATARLVAAGADVLPVPVDVTDFSSCEQAIAAVVEHYGRIDTLVNNAGTVHRSLFEETDVNVYRKVMDVNFFGSLHCAKAALPHLLASRGLIVVTSSIAGIAPLHGRTGYAASKHALHGLFESLRGELLDKGVRVLMVCPSFTRSDFEQRAMGGDGRPVGTKRSMTGKLAEPETVADAVVGAARRGQRLLVLSGLGKLSYYLSRLAPGWYEREMVRRIRGAPAE